MKKDGNKPVQRRTTRRGRAEPAGVIPFDIWTKIAVLDEQYREQVGILHEDRRCTECAALGARYRLEKAALLEGAAEPGATKRPPDVSPAESPAGAAAATCSFCGAPLQEGADGSGSRRLQRYCSRRCRNAAYYYRRRRRVERRKRLRRPKRRCVVCHRQLPPDSRTDRRTCSPRCRIALHRRKQLLDRDRPS